MSKQFITQSPAVAVNALMRDVRAAIAQALDFAAIAGTGSFTFGGAATGADFMAAERTLAAAGVPPPYAVVASPACRETWRGPPQSATVTGLLLWTETDHVAGLPTYVGGNLPGTASSSARSRNSRSSPGPSRFSATRFREAWNIRSGW